jgi:cysteine desulfurase
MSVASVYLDHAATTPVRPEVLEAMLPYLGSERFGNPSSAHRFGREARAGLEEARREVALALGLEPSEVVFTSGGTEADNLAILGACLAARDGRQPMLAAVAATDHKAVLAAAHEVHRLGGEERTLPVGRTGLLDLEALEDVLRLRPAIVSVMWVNNETGVIQPIGEIAARCAARGVLFHTDMVQALAKLPVSLAGLPIGMATISGHKLGAPKGTGALVVRKGVALRPIIHGGGQQAGIRPGTENIAGAVGLGRAVSLAVAEQEVVARRLERLRERLTDHLRNALPDLVIAGEGAPRAPHVLNVLIPGTDSGTLLMHLDLAGVAASSGSACTTGAVEPSHVLVAMGIPRELGVGALRLSLGRETIEADVDRAAQVLPEIVARVRRVSEVLGHG